MTVLAFRHARRAVAAVLGEPVLDGVVAATQAAEPGLAQAPGPPSGAATSGHEAKIRKIEAMGPQDATRRAY
jgi:hypothetical protein